MIYPDFHELIKMGTKPNRLEVASSIPTLASAAGAYNSLFRGQGLSFHEVREYRPGDDIRNIDWRVTARANKPHMKVFTEDRERTVMLCVDANAAMRFGTRGTFKSVQAARATALIGRLANGSHDRVGGVLFGDVPEGLQFFPPTRSRRALWQALRLLSTAPDKQHRYAMPLDTALRRFDRVVPTGSVNFIISDFYPLAETLEKNLANLRRRCDVVLIQMEDPADGIIPPIGSMRFSDDTGRNVVIDTNRRSGQEAYAREWQNARRNLQDICARNAIARIVVQTGHDIYEDLVPALHRLAGNARR